MAGETLNSGDWVAGRYVFVYTVMRTVGAIEITWRLHLLQTPALRPLGTIYDEFRVDKFHDGPWREDRFTGMTGPGVGTTVYVRMAPEVVHNDSNVVSNRTLL